MYTYIVIDDEALIRKGLIKKLDDLKNTAICIGEASNGDEALSIIEKSNPDIIITDMNMPVMDGTAFLPLLSEKYPNKRIIVISGYKDFEYMKHAISAKAIDYVLKPFGREEIQNALLNAIKSIENEVFINKKIISIETEKEHARYEYDIQNLKNSILGYNKEEFSITSDKLKSITQIHNIILITLHSIYPINEDEFQNFMQQNGFGDLAVYLQSNPNGNIGFLILFVPEKSALNYKNLCRQIIWGINAYFGAISNNFSFGISKIHTDLNNLHEAFNETISALDFKKIGDENKYYFYNDEKISPICIEWDKLDEFLFRLETGMTKDVEVLLNKLFDSILNSPKYKIGDVKYFCLQLAEKSKTVLSDYLEKINMNSFSSSIQNILNSLFSINEIKEYCIRFFSNISESLKDKNIYSSNDLIEKIKIYINKNYQKNLSVEFLSSLFYLNRSYCSSIFKKKTGEKLVDYINSVRIEKAKRLLESTDKKMYQISKAVGYDNVKYFFRIFKSKEKISPEQYRNLLKKNFYS